MIAELAKEQERIVAETKAQQAKIIQDAAAERERMIAAARDQAAVEAQKLIDDARKRINEEKENKMEYIVKAIATATEDNPNINGNITKAEMRKKRLYASANRSSSFWIELRTGKVTLRKTLVIFDEGN